MTVGEKLSQSAVQLQDAWTTLTDTWTTTVQDLLDTAAVDPWALFRPDAAMDQMFEWARRTFEINRDLLQDLTGVSVTAEVAVGRELRFVGAAGAAEAPIDVLVSEIEPAEAPFDVVVSEVAPAEVEPVRSEKKATGTLAAGTSGRTSKAALQKALADRQLPASGTIKELRERLIEADRQTPR